VSEAIVLLTRMCLHGMDRESFTFLGAFGKLRKATRSFVISVRPSVRMEQLGTHWTDCHEI